LRLFNHPIYIPLCICRLLEMSGFLLKSYKTLINFTSPRGDDNLHVTKQMTGVFREQNS